MVYTTDYFVYVLKREGCSLDVFDSGGHSRCKLSKVKGLVSLKYNIDTFTTMILQEK